MTAPARTFYAGGWRPNPAADPAAGLTSAMRRAIAASELGQLVRIAGRWRPLYAAAGLAGFSTATIRGLLERGLVRRRGDDTVALTAAGRRLFFHLKKARAS